MSAVYFARFGEYVKIGFSSNPRARLERLANGSRLQRPDDLDTTAEGALILVVPFCRMRDERNMQLLFARHWSGVGEWFHWSPEFRHQMETMQFVTHDERRKYLRAARRDLGIGGSEAKESRWGRQTPELLADIQDGAA